MPIWSAEIKEIEKLYESFKGQLAELEKELGQLIRSDDPNVILLYSRRCLEVIITELCECELKRPRGTEPLKGIIDKLNKEKKIPAHIASSMYGLNELSTYGTHPKDFDPHQVKPVLNNLSVILMWYLKYKDIQIKSIIPSDTQVQVQKPITLTPGKPWNKTRKILTYSFSFLVVIILGAIRFFKHQSDIHWARDEAIPAIKQMIADNDVWRNLVKPYYLAAKAETILGQDSVLEALISQCSENIDIMTEPAGAKVYIKEYIHPDTTWSFLGITPLKNFRVPTGIFRWKIEKEGYDTVYAATLTRGANNNFVRTLDKAGSVPEGMVRVPSTFVPELDSLSIGDFFISRYEATNREYKEFIDAGGYRNQEYWRYPFIKEGKGLTWDEAMNEFVDKSGRPGPQTWEGDYPTGEDDYPVSGVSWYEADAYAEWKGMSLPTAIHWDIARGGYTRMIQVPQLGGFGTLAPFTNFGGNGPVAVGSFPGITSYGAFDMAGNVREWCWNETEQGRVIRGGSWEDNTYEFGNLRQAPAMDRSERNGIRLAFYPDPDSIPPETLMTVNIRIPVDLRAMKPVTDDIFRVYREQFAYDPAALNAIVEYSEERPGGWTSEKVSFDAAYGNERVQVYLFLPDNASPPFQTIIYFPGSASTYTPSSQDLENYYEFPMFLSFLVRNGRAVLYPVYKGTFERSEPKLTAIHDGTNSYAYTEFLIEVVKDFRRCIDYLETRSDIDSTKIAFYGMSWGGDLGAVIPAVENRLKASVLLAGGLLPSGLPEANAINYVTRIKIPTLMLNGKYDGIIPPEISSIPMFDLLGTPDEHKRQILYETDHIPPRTEYIKETLAWLDKYLGQVKLK